MGADALLTAQSGQLYDEAWAYYKSALETTRQLLVDAPQYQLSQMARTQAHLYLQQVQATAYNTIIAPRHDYPRLYTQHVWEPIYSWLAPNPDFIYAYTTLNPRRTYRLSGRVGDAKMIILQLQSMLFGTEMKPLGSKQVHDLEVAGDGSFEIILSAKEQSGNWMALDPGFDENIMTIRRAIVSPDEDIGALAIEPLDDEAAEPFEYTPERLAKRIKAAADQTVFVTEKIALALYANTMKLGGGTNGSWVWGGAGSDIGGAEDATYGFVPYEMAPDEAIIIEADVPETIYWGAQLNDTWLNTLDYIYHQSSLSGGQAQLSADGKFRAVISVMDPGIANWLDPVGNLHGVLILRWYQAARKPGVTVTRLPVNQLTQALPADTPRVNPAQRRAILQERQRGYHRVYST